MGSSETFALLFIMLSPTPIVLVEKFSLADCRYPSGRINFNGWMQMSAAFNTDVHVNLNYSYALHPRAQTWMNI